MNYQKFEKTMKTAAKEGVMLQGIITFAPEGLLGLFPDDERTYEVWSSEYNHPDCIRGTLCAVPKHRQVLQNLNAALLDSPVEKCIIFRYKLVEDGRVQMIFPNRLEAQKEMLRRYYKTADINLSEEDFTSVLERDYDECETQNHKWEIKQTPRLYIDKQDKYHVKGL